MEGFGREGPEIHIMVGDLRLVSGHALGMDKVAKL